MPFCNVEHPRNKKSAFRLDQYHAKALFMQLSFVVHSVLEPLSPLFAPFSDPFLSLISEFVAATSSDDGGKQRWKRDPRNTTALPCQ